jgi:hypothetical protein
LAKVKTKSYILELELLPSSLHIKKLRNLFYINAQIYNVVLGKLYKRYQQMIRTKEYRLLKDNYKKTKNKDALKDLTQLQIAYKLTAYHAEKDILDVKKYFGNTVDSNTAQKTSLRAFTSIEKLISGKSKQVHFKKSHALDSFEGKTNKQGIRFIDSHVKISELADIKVQVKKQDYYANIALQDKVKYCRIVRKVIRSKERFYVQLILEGQPPKKINFLTGLSKVMLGSGEAGMDIGTQSVAVASTNSVLLKDLSPNTNGISRKIELLQRKMDRSRRAMNPHKYKSNGTINKKDKSRWINSIRYKTSALKFKEFHRKEAVLRKQSHEIDANSFISLGETWFYERLNFKALQKRKLKTEKNDKGKFKRKKRFGKSLGKRAPAMFVSIFKRKLENLGGKMIEVDLLHFKASQYDHIDDQFYKKKLSQRWHEFSDGNRVQRDLYSSFLMQCAEPNGSKPDRNKCLEYYEKFKIMHDEFIAGVKKDGITIRNSGIH